jgi:hypothetical protein
MRIWEDLRVNTRQVVLIVVCGIALSGCATVTRGSKDFFEIESEPTGATVALSNGLSCVTPCAMELPRKHPFTATFSLEGYKPLTAEVVPKQAAAGTAGMAGNVLIGGLIGVVADASSGAMKDLYPNPLFANLAAVESSDLSAVVLPEGSEEDDTEVAEGEVDQEGEIPAETDQSIANTNQ